MISGNINFYGIPVAEVKAAGNNLKLYRLNSKDKGFMDNLYKTLDLRRLYPGFNNLQYNIWDEVTKMALKYADNNGKQTLLLTCNNSPCGVANYSHQTPKFRLNYISTWPVNVAQKVPYAGKVLFMELFRQFLDKDCYSMELSALKYAPFNAICKYLSLGFIPCGGDNYQEIMRANKKNISNSLNNLKQNINFIPINHGQEINLTEHLNIIL